MDSNQQNIQYNVYRVFLAQRSGPDYEAIALVPAHLIKQTAGRFYHVKGSVGMGMDYEDRPGYNFGDTRSYRGSTFLFQMPKRYLQNFESIANNRPPPYDPHALTESNPNPPVRDCSAWVNEVIEETRTFLRSNGIDA
jgi:hypothetical protein